jgi:hypothetical protein
MSIHFQDFFPTILKRGFFSDDHENLRATVDRANEWIAERKVRVLNVETVLLPNIDEVADASQVGIRTSGESSSFWYQVIRVWYVGSTP